MPSSNKKQRIITMDEKHHHQASLKHVVVPPLTLTDLPTEALEEILEFLPELKTVLNFANSSRLVSALVAKWQCTDCQQCIFVKDTEGQNLVAAPGAEPFACHDCKGRFCGRQDCGKFFSCNNCSDLECRSCMEDHTEVMFCLTCCRVSFCSDCTKFCTKECDLCHSAACQDCFGTCDKCGITTCGSHYTKVQACRWCGIKLCSHCHGHGQSMWHCDDCQEPSCNALATGNPKCPEFDFRDEDCAQCMDCSNRRKDLRRGAACGSESRRQTKAAEAPTPHDF